MCSICGCESGDLGAARADGANAEPRRQGALQAHAHPGAMPHEIGRAAHPGESATAPAHTHAPAVPQARMLQIEQDILARNDGYAALNRRFLSERGILALNFLSSPGAGKTALLVQTIRALDSAPGICVIEGDQQTSYDADRIRASGARAVQINTGKGCHLDAHMVGHALERLDPARDSMLMIENVGNLVCPAAFDLGEAHKVVVLSVTEGEDKPLKYPDVFRRASLMLLNKVDLLPHLDYDPARCIANARRTNPEIEVICVSATRATGMPQWLAWLEREARRGRRGGGAAAEPAAPRRATA